MVSYGTGTQQETVSWPLIIHHSWVNQHLAGHPGQVQYIGLGWSYVLWIDISLYTSLIGVTQYPWMHRPGISVLRPSSWMNPNFWILGTLLETSAMETLDGEQEPNEKIHGGVFTGASSLWPLNINIRRFFGFVI
jgi:hypothetical protein